MCMMGGGAVLDTDLIQDPRDLSVEALPDPLSACLVYPVPSSQSQQGEDAIIQVVVILRYSLRLILAGTGVNILWAG